MMQHLIVQYQNRAKLNSETTTIATSNSATATSKRKSGIFTVK